MVVAVFLSVSFAGRWHAGPGLAGWPDRHLGPRWVISAFFSAGISSAWGRWSGRQVFNRGSSGTGKLMAQSGHGRSFMSLLADQCHYIHECELRRTGLAPLRGISRQGISAPQMYFCQKRVTPAGPFSSPQAAGSISSHHHRTTAKLMQQRVPASRGDHT